MSLANSVTRTRDNGVDDDDDDDDDGGGHDGVADDDDGGGHDGVDDDDDGNAADISQAFDCSACDDDFSVVAVDGSSRFG